MSRRRPPSLASDVQGPPDLDELFIFSAWSNDDLAERYGSLDRAKRREAWLLESGVLRGHEPRDWGANPGGALRIVDGSEL